MWRAARALQARHAVWRLLGVGCLRPAFPGIAGIASCALVVVLYVCVPLRPNGYGESVLVRISWPRPI